jgi:hypothetical protein
MNRARAMLGFVFGGGLLIFATPYLIYQAATKHLSRTVVILVIPIYCFLSYAAFKTFWPRIKR